MCLSIHQITLLIAIYTVVQGLVVLGINIALILIGTGSLSDTSKSFVRHAAFYLNCPNEAKNNTCPQYAPLNPDAVMGYEITYAVLHGLWLAGAVVLLTQLCKKKAWPDYVLWLTICSLLIVLDTVTGAFYCVDISEDDLKKDDLKNAAVMMALISFRGVAFYVLNIVCLALVAYALRDTLAKQATGTAHQKSKKTTAKTAAVIELTQTHSPPHSNDDTSSRTATPVATHKPELNADSEEEETDPAPVFLGYQADPELIQRNQQVVSQIQQGPGSSMYRSPAYGQPYPGRRLSDTQEYPQEDEDYGGYSGSGDGPPRVAPAYYIPPRAQNLGPDYHSPYAYGNSGPVQDEYPEDDYYRDGTAGPPRVPPRVPSREKRNSSSRHSRPMPPSHLPAPPEEYDKKVPPPVPPKKAPYDVRPFSYVNPSFRPADHGDVVAMKSNSADIKKTLVEDLEQLKMKETLESAPHHNTPVAKPIDSDSNREHSGNNNDRSDTAGHHTDAPWNSSNNSGHKEGWPDQHNNSGEYVQELMTTV